MELDVSTAADQIERLIEKRAAERERVNWQADLWKKSVERHHARQRQQNRAAWYGYCRLADAHAQLSEEFARRAEQLCETGSGEER